MSGWLSHLVLGSTGLALTALATALVLRAWQRLPVASYRLAVAVLAAALALPAAQLGARALGLPFEHPVRALVEALRREPVSMTVAAPRPAAAPVAAAEDGAAVAAPAALSIDPALLALVLLGQEAEAEPAQSSAAGSGATTAPARHLPWRALLALAYLTGVGAALARTARRLLRTRSLLRSARRVRDPRVREVWREVAGSLPLARRVRLLESDQVRAPSCFGLGRPAVVLPPDEDLAKRREVLACVLTHELVHLERRDGWVLLGEELLRAVFWFHPAAWWLVARLERLREVSCDSLVVRRTGQRKRYAQALVEYAAWMQAGERILGGRAGQAAAVVPWSGSKGQLTRRIEMLLSREAPSGGRGRYVAPAAVGLVFTFLWSGQLALAASAPQQAGVTQHEECAHGQEHCAECGHHATGTSAEVKGGVIIATQGKDGAKATLKADRLELKPGQKILVSRGDGDVQMVDTLVQQGDAPIGIVLGEADDTLAAQLGEDKRRVVVIRSVVPGSRAEKAGLQEHDVIVRVDGEGGSRQDLIDHAKQALGEGRDVEVVVIRKGDRKPLVLRFGDGRSAAVWVQKENGEQQVFDLALPQEHKHRVQVESDGAGRYRVFGLGGDALVEDEEIEVEIEELNDVIGLGGGAGGASRSKQKQGQKIWTDEDGRIHIETTVEVAPEGEHRTKARVFGLGSGSELHEHKGMSGAVVEEHVEGDGHVQVLRLDGKGRIVTGGEHGEHVIELHLDGDEAGKVLRSGVQDYYRQVDPEEFKEQLQKALSVYELHRKDFTAEDVEKMRKLKVYAEKDAQEALEQARKQWETLSEEEIAERTRRALEESDLLLEESAKKLYSGGKSYRLAEPDTVEVPPSKIEALKAELNATRKQLEVQRKQIEELKRALEKLARERERELR